MSCGRIPIVSRIKLMIYVWRHPEWDCRHFCPACKFVDYCMNEMEAEKDGKD